MFAHHAQIKGLCTSARCFIRCCHDIVGQQQRISQQIGGAGGDDQQRFSLLGRQCTKGSHDFIERAVAAAAADHVVILQMCQGQCGAVAPFFRQVGVDFISFAQMPAKRFPIGEAFQFAGYGVDDQHEFLAHGRSLSAKQAQLPKSRS